MLSVKYSYDKLPRSIAIRIEKNSTQADGIVERVDVHMYIIYYTVVVNNKACTNTSSIGGSLSSRLAGWLAGGLAAAWLAARFFPMCNHVRTK